MVDRRRSGRKKMLGLAFNQRTLVASLIALSFVLGAQAGVARAVSVTEFPSLPHESSLPGGVATGPDGAVWFTELNSYPFTDGVGRVGRLTPDGALTEYSVPGTDDAPNAIAQGPDGNLWFTNSGTDTIGRITPQGAVTEFGGIVSGGAPQDIAAGPDGALWFTEAGYNRGNRIGRIAPGGAVQEFCIRTCSGPAGSPEDGLQPGGIVAGPDSRLWFTEANPSGTGYVAAASLDGHVQEYPVPTANAQPTDIALGGDGALWFTERATGKIGRVTTSGAVTEFSIVRPPDANWITQSSWPTAIARGPDGAVWFVENHANRIGRVDASGTFAHWTIPESDSNPGGIGLGPDARMYFTETSGNRLGAVTTDFVADGGSAAGQGGGTSGAPKPRSDTASPRAIVRVDVTTRWQARRGRWLLLVRGTLGLRRGAQAPTQCARRRVEIRLRRGGKVLGLRRVRASRRCLYSTQFVVGPSARRPVSALFLAVRVPDTRPVKQIVKAVRAPLPRRR
jgi:streptogramin lyase